MLDFRVKKPGGALNWRYQEIFVTQPYIEQNGMHIRLDAPYEMGKKVLDVYYQGQRLTEGAGYEEIDNLTIKLNLGSDEDDNPIPLRIGDEIVIKEWFNSASVLYGVNSLNQRLTTLEVEIGAARGGRNNLGQRLDSMEADILGLINGGNGIGDEYTFAPINVAISYSTDAKGGIIKEEAAGDVAYVKHMEHDADGNLTKERIAFDGQVYDLDYGYDASGFLMHQTGQRLELVTMLSYLMQKDVRMLLGEGDHDIDWEYDELGREKKMVVSGSFSLIKETFYNANGTIHREVTTHHGKRTTKTYQYDPVTNKKTKAFSTTVTI